MITIKNVKTLSGKVENITIDGPVNQEIDAEGKLTLLPGLIDAHVHFCTPGHADTEDWKSGAAAAIAGGVTTVFDMPNNDPPTNDLKSLNEKRRMIDQQLSEIKIPLRYKLYIAADKNHFEDITLAKEAELAIKVYIGSSTNGLAMDDETSLERIFQLGAQNNIMIAVRGEAERAIMLAEKFGAQLYLLDVHTKNDLDFIRKAKKRHLLVYAEATPYHLFHTDKELQKDQEALWAAINDRTIDSIGSNHSPHLINEKNEIHAVPAIETMLPLLLNAVNEKKITLEQLVNLFRINLEYIYNLERNKDFVLVDMNLEKEVRNENLKTKCGWSPYAGKVLKGWPIYTILKGQIHKVG